MLLTASRTSARAVTRRPRRTSSGAMRGLSRSGSAGGAKGQQRGHGMAGARGRSEGEPGRGMATAHGGVGSRPPRSPGGQACYPFPMAAPSRAHTRCSARGLVPPQPHTGLGSIHAVSPGAAMDVCPGLAPGYLTLLWILSLFTPLCCTDFF